MTSVLEGGRGYGKADKGNGGYVNVTVAGGIKKIRAFCGRHIWKALYFSLHSPLKK